MNTLKRIFIVMAVSCGAAWLAKMAAIAANGPSESTLIGVLWGIGMVTFLLASGTGTALLLAKAPVWARIAAGVAAVPVSFWLLDMLGLAIKSVYVSDSWLRDEVALIVAGVVFAAIGLRLASTERQQHA
jgi:hypothetical protein